MDHARDAPTTQGQIILQVKLMIAYLINVNRIRFTTKMGQTKESVTIVEISQNRIANWQNVRTPFVMKIK